MQTFGERLRFVLDMHNKLRCTCPEPSTPEGRFVNENTVVRLAAMMESEKLKPRPKAESHHISDAEMTVRVLLLFRNLILHNGGRLDLSGSRRTCQERKSYDSFCHNHRDANVSEGEFLCLSADMVISPLVQGCINYWQERGHA